MSYYPHLFSPINIGEMELANRIVLAPMSTNYATEQGFVSQRLIDYFVERARGGVGLVISESNYVSIEGRSGIHRLGLSDDNQMHSHKELTEALHAIGTPICAQLHHAGTAASVRATGQFPVSCSAIPLMAGGGPFAGNTPRRLSENEIHDLAGLFSKAAERAKTCGYDAVMVHATHGYLIHQFLSPRTNKREDRYGGNGENRARFLIEICRSIKKQLGTGYPLLVRLTGKELVDGGYGIDYMLQVACWLEKEGVDEISISAGSKEELGSPCASAAFAEGFRADDSAVLKGAVKIPVGVVGRIMTPEAADQIIKDGKADLVYVGRALIADPELPKKAKEGRREEIRPCIVCNRGCIDRLRANLDVRCAVNAALGQEKPNAPRTAQPRKVLIVGGGPAGLEAARMAAWRGHRVTLYEASHQLGGKLNSVIRSNHKEPVARLIQYYTRQMEMLNVDMELGAEVTPDIITTFRPDVLIVAVGALPLQLELPGIHLPHVRSAEECLRDRASLGHKVAIVGGGMVGIEVADVLVESGREVTIVEQLESITDKMGSLMEDLTLRLCSKGVHIYVNTRVRAVTHQGLIVERLGKSEALAVENIVIAAGYRPHLDIMKGIDVTGIEYHEIGDCVQPRTILEAVAEGYRAGSAI